jgi:hypothetical protein
MTTTILSGFGLSAGLELVVISASFSIIDVLWAVVKLPILFDLSFLLADLVFGILIFNSFLCKNQACVR